MAPLLSTAYLPPIEYFAFLIEDEVRLEFCEHFQKQSFRSRAVILTSNGPLTLSIPVIHHSDKELISESRIKYITPWQRTHWRAIESAYGASPYFLYYQDLLRPFYEQPYDSLFEFNTQLTKVLLKLLQTNTDIRLTEDFEPIRDKDLRTLIHPRRKSEPDYPLQYNEPYYQVFSNKFGFTPGLSVIDLIFNLGPDAIHYLQRAHDHFKSSIGIE